MNFKKLKEELQWREEEEVELEEEEKQEFILLSFHDEIINCVLKQSIE